MDPICHRIKNTCIDQYQYIRNAILLLLVIAPFICHSQSLTMDDIPVTWSSFKKVNYDTAELSSYTAVTYPDYSFKYRIESKDGQKYYHIQCGVRFNMNRSCVSQQFLQNASAGAKQQLLNHEKGHYIISMIGFKELTDTLESLQELADMKECVEKIASGIFTEINEIDKAYDLVTNHGMHPDEQQKREQALLDKLNGLYKGKLETQKDIYIPLGNNFYKLNDPVHYKYPDNPTIAFEDNFDDDRNHWLAEVDAGVSQAGIDYSINNGHFDIANHKKDGGWLYQVAPDIDYSKDYEIEIAFRINDYKNKFIDAVMFGWGVDSMSGNAGTQIQFTWLGTFEIRNCLGGNHKACYTKHGSARIFYKDGYNVFNLRKTGNTYYVFVNGRFEKSIPANQLKGKELYLGANKLSAVSYDYLKIYYLN